MTLYSLRHVLHGAVDGRVLDLEPVVSVPAYQKPHVFLPVELLLKHLRDEQGDGEGERKRERAGERVRNKQISLNGITANAANNGSLTSQNTFLASVS